MSFAELGILLWLLGMLLLPGAWALRQRRARRLRRQLEYKTYLAGLTKRDVQ